MTITTTFTDAARYLRILYHVELAHATGDEEQIVSLLSGVDPSDVYTLATALDAAAASLQDPGTEPPPAISPPRSEEPPTGSTEADGPPSVPGPYPRVVHASDNWSRKV